MDINKIFQIGFNKCGTSSIHELFEKKCYTTLRCIHWDDGKLAQTINENILSNNLPILGRYNNYDVFTDMEHSSKDEIILVHKKYFSNLDKHYPNSKFILNIRPIDHWITSRLKHEQNSEYSYLDKYKIIFNIKSTDTIIRLWKKDWHEHIYNVTQYFKYRPKDLLVFDIENHDFSKFKEFFDPYLQFNVDILPHLYPTRL